MKCFCFILLAQSEIPYWPVKRTKQWLFVPRFIYFRIFSSSLPFLCSLLECNVVLVHITSDCHFLSMLFGILSAADSSLSRLAFLQSSILEYRSITKKSWELHPHFLHGRMRDLALFYQIPSCFVRSSRHLLRRLVAHNCLFVSFFPQFLFDEWTIFLYFFLLFGLSFFDWSGLR